MTTANDMTNTNTSAHYTPDHDAAISAWLAQHNPPADDQTTALRDAIDNSPWWNNKEI
jgi:hypothetical protein